MIKVIELFAGIGAQRQALKDAGVEHEVVAISDNDRYASRAYELLHGPTPNLGDITKVERLPLADLWTYSFPCTDISISGRMLGFDQGSGTGSSLLWEVQRLLTVASADGALPRYLLMENVKNIVSKKFMGKFREWTDFLEGLGYRNYWKVMDAKNYGVPQHRERCFMVSILGDGPDFAFPDPIPLEKKLKDCLDENVDESFFLSERLITTFCSMKNRNGLIRGLRFRPKGEKDEYAWTLLTSGGSRVEENYIIVPVSQLKEEKTENTTQNTNDSIIIPEATKTGFAIAHEGDGVYTNRVQWKRGVVQRGMIPTLKTSCSDIAAVVHDQNELISLRRLTPRECWRLMGWQDADINKVIGKGITKTQLYKMAGNSIVIDCLRFIFAQLFQTEAKG